METSRTGITNSLNPKIRPTGTGLKEVHDVGSVRCSAIYPEKFSGRGPIWGSGNYDDDMCPIDDEDDLVAVAPVKYSSLLSADFNKSFNPMSEPNDDWSCKFDDSPALEKSGMKIFSSETTNKPAESPGESGNGDNDFTFPSGSETVEDDDEVTELKIRAFLDEKALDLKKLQSPLYEEFYNSLIASIPSSAVGTEDKENISHDLNLPPKSRSPNRAPSRRLSAAVDAAYTASPRSSSKCVPNVGSLVNQTLQEVKSPSHGEMKEDLLDSRREPISPSASFSERQRKLKEELDEELERKREMMRHTGVVKTSSPAERSI